MRYDRGRMAASFAHRLEQISHIFLSFINLKRSVQQVLIIFLNIWALCRYERASLLHFPLDYVYRGQDNPTYIKAAG
jgi:hypothetical protein